MKSIRMKKTMQDQIASRLAGRSRQGSTLLVVIALLAILSLLGVVFYTFASQEYNSAGYFAEAALNEADPGIESDVLFNFALEQLIKGPNDGYYNSALWGKRSSLLGNMFGSDIHPYSGQAINVILSGGAPAVDQNYDGTPDNANLLEFNISPSAQGTVLDPTALPAPDVDYTYPDINNLFLAHNSHVRDGSDEPNPNPPGTPPMTSPVHVAHVIIPSFHRPQYLRDASGDLIPDWYTDMATRSRIFRPHRLHEYFRPDGTANGDRFETMGGDAFPFQPTDIAGGNPTTHGEMGIWTGSHGLDSSFPQNELLVYELDVDNDGDTIREGIWMDLDFPPIEDPTNPGTYVIPLFSFTVYDLDGLINLNTAGNMRLPGDDVLRDNEIDLNYGLAPESFGGNLSGSRNQWYFLSRSNMGLSSPGEINPQWALTSTGPSNIADLNQHRFFFGEYPGSWLERSNMEYFFLNVGRADFSPPAVQNGVQADVVNLYAGRWGEAGFLFDNLRGATGDPMYLQKRDVNGNVTQSFPRAGITGNDDNEDRFEGTYLSGSLVANSNLRAGSQSFGHPLAHNGSGRMNRTGANYRRRYLAKPLASNPSVWPAYSGIETADSTGHPGSYGAAVPPNNTQAIRYPASLFNPTRNSAIASRSVLLDDSDEIVVDLDRVNRKYDEPFGPDELAYLLFSNTDISNHGVISRLKSLLPYNFAKSSTAEDIRKNFTTASWDRKQFSRAQITGSSFPPAFIPAGTFRPEVEHILAVNSGNRTSALQQFKLNLNELLVTEDSGTGKTVTTRPLTPHPGEDKNGNGTLDTGEDLNGNNQLDSLAATQISTSWDSSNRPSYPPQNAQQQEFWARFDRQRMARDIYTLLYTIDTRQNGGSNPNHTANDMLEMAQFAVNMVDALDPDDVLTRFEYDTDIITDGWSLDDNPYTREAVGQRGVVWGVEAQQLTLSELLMVECEDQDMDRTVTPFPDDKVDGTDDKRLFTAIELRNSSPYSVSFGTNGKWMLGLEVNGVMLSYAIPKNRSVSAGGLFTLVATNAADNMQLTGSDPYSEFRVDLDANGDFSDPGELIIPSTTIAGANKIDMVTDQATTSTLVTILNSGLTASSSGPGSFLDQAYSDITTATTVKIKLFRKAHLGRDTFLATGGLPLPDNDNPWVLVDQLIADKSTFDLPDEDAAAQLSKNAMKSTERSQPFDYRNGVSLCDKTGNILNTSGANNQSTTALPSSRFTLWQPHFDRNFASPIELLSVPIVGPNQQITASFTNPNATSDELDNSDDAVKTRDRLITYALTDGSSKQTGANVQVAGIQKFLDPDGANNMSPDSDDSYWYRLFEYVEVPSRMHREGKTNPFSDPRTPGKINLNTMRHASVLAALLDDTDLIRLGQYSASIPYYNKVPFLHDTVDGNSRDWWEQFTLARDQATLDSAGAIVPFSPTLPASGSRQYPVPGLPGSKPFRSLDFKAESASNIKNSTVFRALPDDLATQPDDPRHLFEVATLTEHTSGGASGSEVDFHTRNQILSKIMGNTTNRSNVFVVFMSVAYFKATSNDFNDPSENVKIGSRQSPIDPTRTVNQSDYRGFFVIDRTRAEEAFEPSTNDFDHWKRLVRYRFTLQE